MELTPREKDKLLVTVFHTDDEAAGYWKKIAGFSDDRIIRTTWDAANRKTSETRVGVDYSDAAAPTLAANSSTRAIRQASRIREVLPVTASTGGLAVEHSYADSHGHCVREMSQSPLHRDLVRNQPNANSGDVCSLLPILLRNE
mgnify:CR=1 FL=1